MIRDPAPLSICERALDGFWTGATAALSLGLGVVVGKMAEVSFAASLWAFGLPPMPGRPW